MSKRESISDINLKELLTEQIMRMSDDILLAAKINKNTFGSKALKSNIGRLLLAHPDAIIKGSPLAHLLEIDRYDPNWRKLCPPAEGSLWLKIEFAKQILPKEKLASLSLLEIYYLLAQEN